MSYNEFMKKFNEYIKIRIRLFSYKYRSQKEMGLAYGISTSTINRAIKSGNITHENLIKMFGEDIYNEDIDVSNDNIEIIMLKNRLKELEEKDNFELSNYIREDIRAETEYANKYFFSSK